MKHVIGISIVLLLGGVFLLQENITAGTPVSEIEARNIWAGCDVHNAGVYRTVCAANCGGTTSKPVLTSSSQTGSTSATHKCVTGGSCAYVDLSSNSCSGSGG